MQKRITIFFITNFILLSIAGIAQAMCEPLKFTTTGLSSEQVHEIVKKRIASGKDLNLPIDEVRDEKNKRYSYPIILCCNNNPPQTATLELMFQHHANPNMLDFTTNDNDFPIDIICKSLSSHTHIHALRLLLNARADLTDGKCLISLCEKPQNEALLKNPELRIEAMELLLSAKAYIPYNEVLIALLKSISPELPAEEYQTLLQERKHLICQLLRTNVGIFNKENPNFFDIDLTEKHPQLNHELVEYIRNHEIKRCQLNKSRYSLLLQLECARKKNPLSSFNLIPQNVIKQITLLVYPKMSAS